MKSSLPKSTQRGAILPILFIILLVIGIVAGVYLIRKQTTIKSKASSDAVKVKSGQGQDLPEENGIPVTDDLNVQLELNPPPAPQ